jgi:ATP-binding protein involved in chromosome partitioning
MGSVTESMVLDALRNVKDPDLGRDIVALGFVKDVKICDGLVGFTIELTTPACPVREQMKSQAQQFVSRIPGVTDVNVKMTAQVRQTGAQNREKLIPKVKNIIPVGSGKGGVGKSTVAANLALALHRMGAKVGLMDADVYGPSIPNIMGAQGPLQQRGDKMIPIERYGIGIMSMGFLLPEDKAAIMRGPMLHKYMEAFLGQVEWGELDYLIVDLPPGTGDVQLSLCQIIPLTGAVVVSTPQDVALKVAQKAILMFRQLQCPILGLVENMSYYECPNCHHRDNIFSTGGAQRYCMMNGIPFLGAVPLATAIRETADGGKPIVISDPESPLSQAYVKLAEQMAAQVSVQAMSAQAVAPSDKITPVELTQPARQQLRIKWKDGAESLLNAFDLRASCHCATCVDEMTGKKIVKLESIPKDVWPVSISPVGRYGIHINWSDGHSTGIYTFERLRQLTANS